MSTPINWSTMTEHQRDTLIAEKIFAWRWIPAETFSKSVKKDTAWLLPEHGLSAITYDFEAGWIDIGEKRFIPRNWILRYTASLEAAWLIADRFDVIDLLRIEKSDYRINLCKDNISAQGVSATAQEAICLAALRSVGCEVEA